MVIKNNTRGFSLMQALIGVGIIGITLAAFMELLNFAGKSQKNVQNAVDFDILKTSINLVLNSKACDSAFVPTTGLKVQFNYASSVAPGTNILSTPVPLQKILQGSSSILDMGQPNLGGGMKLSKLEFADAIYDGQQNIGGIDYDAFVATLNIEAQKQQGSMGKPVFEKKFSTRLLLSSSAGGGLIEKCSSAVSAIGLTQIQSFTSNTTWPVPAGVTSIKATLVGGGGAGGGSSNGGWGGSGGAGAYLQTVLLGIAPNSTLTLQVGDAGIGVSGGTLGANGGDSKILNGLTLLAHVQGGRGAPGNSVTPGAGGSVVVGSGLSITGASGFPSRIFDNVNGGILTGLGGSSPLGAGGSPVPCLPKDWGATNYTNSPGQSATGYGAGGSGSVSCGGTSSPSIGGNGSPGIIIIEY